MNANQYNEKNALDGLQEELSLAALHTIVARVGGAILGTSHKSDVMGVDATCLFQGRLSQVPDAKPSATLHVQLKSTRNPKSITLNGEEYWVLYVDVVQLRKYIAWRDELIFALYVLPSEEEQERWLEVDSESIVLRKSLFWTSLVDFPFEPDKLTNAVYISKKSLLTPDTLRNVVTARAERKGLPYVQPQ